eukprot:1962934-Pyramimonas_sp.AAC.1
MLGDEERLERRSEVGKACSAAVTTSGAWAPRSVVQYLVGDGEDGYRCSLKALHLLLLLLLLLPFLVVTLMFCFLLAFFVL